MSSNTSATRSAIIGAGLMGYWHADAICRAGSRVVAVVDTDLEIARRLAKYHAGATAYSDLSQLLSAEAVDVIHICSPLSTHYHIAERVIDAGIHLIVEKPMTQTAADAKTLLDLAKRRSVRVCPVHQFVFQNGLVEAREQLSKVGQLIDITAIALSAGGMTLPAESLDEIVADILPHPLSLMQAIMPSEFLKIIWAARRPAAGELRATGTANGTSYSIVISMNARPTLNSLEIRGTQNTIYADLFHGYSYVQSGSVSRLRKIARPFEHSMKHLTVAGMNLAQRVVHREPAYPGLRRLVHSFYEAIRNDSPTPISGEEIHGVAQTRDQLILLAGLKVQAHSAAAEYAV